MISAFSSQTMWPSRRHLLKRLALIASISVIPGCSVFSPIPQSRGALIEKSDFKLLIPGTSTKSDVLGVIGSPTAHAAFNDNDWIYISLTTIPRPLGFPEVTRQNIVVLTFNDAGVLNKMSTLRKKDGFAVGMVRETTPAPGTKVNVMQQLLGNVGRYNPLGAMSNSTFGGSQGPLGAGVGTGNGGAGNTLP